MASLAGVVQQIVDSLDSPYDFMLKKRIEDEVISNRALFIRREYDKTRQFPSYSIYEVALPIQEEDDCNGCTGAKITDKFPRLIAVKDDIPFKYVGTTTRKEAISYISPDEIGIFQHNKVSGHMPRYTVIGGKILVINVGNIKKVLARGAFADPRELAKYSCDGEACFSQDDEGFVEDHLAPLIKQNILSLIRNKVPEHEVQVNGSN